MNKRKSLPGVMLYAKTPGLTSFASLWSIKHALNTEKLGHTGTLDSFAEGLLVVLSGSLTHLVPHITGFTKTYQAVVRFGKETDTLDPTGSVISEGISPSKDDVLNVLPDFTGAILQVPPVYSALHVDGKRASDMIREGEKVNLESRQVFIYKIDLLDFKSPCENDSSSYALLEITCSKGTYIRALARDIAKKLGTCAYLSALRRTKVGPFKLEDSACYFNLKPFTIDNGIENDLFFQNQRKVFLAQPKKSSKPKVKDSDQVVASIRSHFYNFDIDMAYKCGFSVDILKSEYEKNYLNGRPLFGKMFTKLQDKDFSSDVYHSDEIAVFYEDSTFAGMIKKSPEKKLTYSFVVHKDNIEKKAKVFTWEQVLNGEFPIQWKNKGVALSVGNFDGIHLGHFALIDKLKSYTDLISGLVIFKNLSSSLKNYESDEVETLYQKVALCSKKALDFVVVIDFSSHFSRMEGDTFIDLLLEYLNMKVMIEGQDFRCGYKGSFGIKELSLISEKKNFDFISLEDVYFEGEKLSSSRVRKSILNADFSAVQKMLQRPFSYDCYGLKWSLKKESSQDGMLWFTCTKVSNQILPPDGNYNVVAIMSSEDKVVDKESSLNTLHTLFSIEGETFSILLPSENVAKRIRTINFIPAV